MNPRTRKTTDYVPVLLGVAIVLLVALGAVRLLGLVPSEVVSANPGTAEPTKAKSPLLLAADYLWSRQAKDGGWHSEKYGLLRSGQALTPFVLHALLTIPEEISPARAEAVENALAFIRKHTNEEGVLGVADPDVLEYPNYATAYALRCLELVGAEEDRERIARMRSYLQSEQFTMARGFPENSPAFGGWGFGGRQPQGEPGHMDIAHTRRVLQTLNEAKVADQQLFMRAERFLRVVQARPQPDEPRATSLRSEPQLADVEFQRAEPDSFSCDGGFYFSPVVLAANKGRDVVDEKGQFVRYRSYATSTCDGVLSLLACGVSPADPRLQDATRWLREHPNLDYPAGVPTDHPEPWGEAIHFYHLAARAEVYQRLDWPGDWRNKIESLTAGAQRADGSFVNDKSHLMKEDDPYLCTALAVVALNHVR